MTAETETIKTPEIVWISGVSPETVDSLVGDFIKNGKPLRDFVLEILDSEADILREHYPDSREVSAFAEFTGDISAIAGLEATGEGVRVKDLVERIFELPTHKDFQEYMESLKGYLDKLYELFNREFRFFSDDYTGFEWLINLGTVVSLVDAWKEDLRGFKLVDKLVEDYDKRGVSLSENQAISKGARKAVERYKAIYRLTANALTPSQARDLPQ